MSTMQIAVFPMGRERKICMRDFLTSFPRITQRDEVKCRITSTGAIIKADKEILLEILDELDNVSFREVATKVAITIDFNESRGNGTTQSELVKPALDREISSENFWKTELQKKTLYDLVEGRLGKYIQEEQEVIL